MAKNASTMGNALVAGARAVASHLSLRATSALPNGRISKVAPKKQTANARVSSAAVGGALMALPATSHGNATQVQMFGTVAATLRFFINALCCVHQILEIENHLHVICRL